MFYFAVLVSYFARLASVLVFGFVFAMIIISTLGKVNPAGEEGGILRRSLFSVYCCLYTGIMYICAEIKKYSTIRHLEATLVAVLSYCFCYLCYNETIRNITDL